MLDGFDGVTQARPLIQRRAAADIELGQRLDQKQVVPLTGRFDSLALLLRGGERVALAAVDLGYPNDPDGPALLRGGGGSDTRREPSERKEF
jgi:hypothetical protein